ncbi:DUF2500 domain-containing protein [Oscillospiraceae bacterium PP1C4]
MSPFGFNFMFSIFPVIFFIIFAIVIGSFIVSAVKGAKQYRHNEKSPVLTVDAKVVTKRTNVRHHHHHAGNDDMAGHGFSSTDYYVTFEVESGDRMEFEVGDREYGMLCEGDRGKLTFQGTRYQGFERTRS